MCRHAEPQLSASRLHRRIDSGPPRHVAAAARIRAHAAADSVENRCGPAVLLRVTLNECQRSTSAAAASSTTPSTTQPATTTSSAAAALQSPSSDTNTFAAAVAIAFAAERNVVVRGRSAPQQPNNHTVPSRTNILFLDRNSSHKHPTHHTHTKSNPINIYMPPRIQLHTTHHLRIAEHKEITRARTIHDD